MRVLINYASGGRFAQSQLLNSQTGLACGFNVVYQMSNSDIDTDFSTKNTHVLNQRRGAGYWLWKPYFVNRLISSMTESDVLFYADSGSVFIKHLDPIFNAINEDKNGVLAFQMSGRHIEKYFTKRDVIRKLDAEYSEFTDTPQRMASFMAFRGTDFAKQLVGEYLSFCCDPHLITDEPNHDGWIEPGFNDNRHDQSIWSLLTKRYSVNTLPDPTQWGLFHGETTQEDMFINHTRDSK